MAVSVFDLFKIGIGPSSSHTVGPMRAARLFALRLQHDGLLPRVQRLQADLYGSLGATGKGHGSDKAVLLGLLGHEPDTVDVEAIPALLKAVRDSGRLMLAGTHGVEFAEKRDLQFHRRESLPLHANGMRFSAFDAAGSALDDPRVLLGRRRLRRQRRGRGRRQQAQGHRARHHGAAAALPQRRGPARASRSAKAAASPR